MSKKLKNTILELYYLKNPNKMGNLFSEDVYLFCSKCKSCAVKYVCSRDKYNLLKYKTNFWCYECKDDTLWSKCSKEKACHINNGKTEFRTIY